MTTPEERTDLARRYADLALEKVDPALALATYTRKIKMDAPVFSGNDIEAAYLAGLVDGLTIDSENGK